MAQAYAAINAAKANFDDIYSQQDPRGYFSVLGALDYMIPDVAGPVIRQLLAARAGGRDSPLRVLDVGCSYGINAAVHRFPLSFRALRKRYASAEMAALPVDRLASLDRSFYASWPEIGVARFTGLDVSAPAVRYALEVGLIDAGIVADFESASPARRDIELLRHMDVVLATGCIGYVTDRTFRAILGAMERPPWVISFVLRMFPYHRIETALARRGMVTERLGGATFVQRRFRDIEEFTGCLDGLASRGFDTTGLESEGRFHAELFVSRPWEEARAAPLADIVTVTSGRHYPVGARYVRIGGGAGTLITVEP